MNALTSSQSYSWHQVLFMYVRLQSFLILLSVYSPRSCSEALCGLKPTSSRLSLTGPCLMFVPWTFCLPLWFFYIDTGHWMSHTVFCDCICETQKIWEFTYCTTKLWSLGDKTLPSGPFWAAYQGIALIRLSEDNWMRSTSWTLAL